MTEEMKVTASIDEYLKIAEENDPKKCNDYLVKHFGENFHSMDSYKKFAEDVVAQHLAKANEAAATTEAPEVAEVAKEEDKNEAVTD